MQTRPRPLVINNWRFDAEKIVADVCLDDALDDILLGAKAPARVLICGSHYLVGALLADNG